MPSTEVISLDCPSVEYLVSINSTSVSDLGRNHLVKMLIISLRCFVTNGNKQSYESICLYSISIYVLKHRLSCIMHINVPICVPAMPVLMYIHIFVKSWTQWKFCPRLHKELGSNPGFFLNIHWNKFPGINLVYNIVFLLL